MVCCDSISHAEQISRISPRPTWTRSLYGSINVHGRPWDSKLLPTDYEWCCSDQLNPPPQSGQSADMLACRLSANRVLTRRSKSTTSLPSPMLINCTQTELDVTGRRSRLGTWPTRHGFMPAGQVGELWSDFYVCQTTADVDCDQRGDVGDRETVASDKLVPA